MCMFLWLLCANKIHHPYEIRESMGEKNDLCIEINPATRRSESVSRDGHTVNSNGALRAPSPAVSLYAAH